ncbi:3-hydroxyacyl-CoA dehydrogenase NAD-binding domain-containing protein [Mangrovibrevibacter kandeliae]|uniref:3-hydroxyacyl-CoA dehydrogenase NAD-binding domain-containing protein n=1 Tax=Mangrovibrevibacter kandeliae TaxID=2968473 RepID=UPI002118F943|nr:3-hydroxyacyl-CoA dehydrogenase NAD-binding domain-containing protein [Aurantimonas sp. CSK15Z-1]MCQ8780701.1 3-hydroxyacyl-CoA dehydrogenase NAD-binding domain-containing protein [Aurantimonas sp. CSK15Z-1]
MGRMLDALADRTLELGPTRHVEREGNWRAARDGEGLFWLVLDRPDKSVNVIDRAVLEELDALLDRIEAEKPAGVVLRSAKPSGFAAGADINQFVALPHDEILAMLRDGHRVFDRLAALPRCVAVIHGHCLGGGLELALACRHRIAIQGAGLGFPEVMLGFHPGLGGTFRATGVADPIEAMTLMLNGKTLQARQAKRIGLVDAVTEERHVHDAVLAAVHGELRTTSGSFQSRALQFRPARTLAAARMRKSVAEKAPREHYPAPYRLIDLWEAHGGNAKAMQAGEIDSFVDLIATDTSRNLVRVFFLREAMKGLRKGRSGVRHVHVIGAGAMGGEIAAWAAKQGFDVTLEDIALAPIGKAIRSAGKMLAATLKDPLLVRDALDRLVPDPGGLGVRHADIVIEAAPERIELKRQIYAKVEPKLKPGALLATNTSAIPLPDLAEGLADPSRLVGLHFFNPVSRMQLIEVVGHDRIDPETERRATAFATELGKLPAPVASAPGFLVNRALTPYLAEAMILLEEGIPKERIDDRAERFGMPMGPVELADQVGLDIALEVSTSLRERLGPVFPEVPDRLRRMVADKRLGRKTGSGLYEWDSDGKPRKMRVDALPDESKDDPDLLDRLILPMLNAVVACLREGVVASEDIADGAMIFGTGFAPFRGGPIAYARTRGIGEIVRRLEALQAVHGERFRPDPGWQSLG